jgi:exodeoxyribonuclease V beta subunit
MPVMQSWQMTSYSALSKQQSTLHDSIDTHMITADTLKLDEGTNDDVDANDQQLDRYTFPRGASAGSFLHSILEVLVFDHLSELDEVIEQKGQWFGIDEKWNVMLQQWISDILLSSLGFNKNYCLADLSAHQYMPEMEFYLPLTQVGAKICIGLWRSMTIIYKVSSILWLFIAG